MEEERKSVLETTKPSDALGRLKERTSHSRTTFVIVAVILAIGLVVLVTTILNNTIQGSVNVRVPSVTD